jgi:hypothetical protein
MGGKMSGKVGFTGTSLKGDKREDRGGAREKCSWYGRFGEWLKLEPGALLSWTS